MSHRGPNSRKLIPAKCPKSLFTKINSRKNKFPRKFIPAKINSNKVLPSVCYDGRGNTHIRPIRASEPRISVLFFLASFEYKDFFSGSLAY